MSRRARKILVVTVLVVLVIGLLSYANVKAESATFSVNDAVRVRARAVQSTFRVSGRSCVGAVTATGFVVNDQLLTNAHVTPAADVIKIDTADGPTVVTVFHRSSHSDVALAEFVSAESSSGWAGSGQLGSLALAPSDPAVGTQVLLVGHPGGEGVAFIESSVHLYGDSTDWGLGSGGGRVMLIDTVTSGGYSGGPVFNRLGEVVGMLQGIDEATGLSLAIPVSELRQILDQHATASTTPLSNCSEFQETTEK